MSVVLMLNLAVMQPSLLFKLYVHHGLGFNVSNVGLLVSHRWWRRWSQWGLLVIFADKQKVLLKLQSYLRCFIMYEFGWTVVVGMQMFVIYSA